MKWLILSSVILAAVVWWLSGSWALAGVALAVFLMLDVFVVIGGM
jgi:hypothetical protein